MARSSEDFGDGRTFYELLNELIERSWGYDEDSDAFGPTVCSVCGEPASMDGGRLHHLLPRNATWAALAYLAGRTAHEPRLK